MVAPARPPTRPPNCSRPKMKPDPRGLESGGTCSSVMMQDHLFVYGTLMRGVDHPMAKLLSRSADFLGDARCRGRLYLVKHYPGLVLSDDPSHIVFGELYRLRDRDALLGEFDMYEACG